MGKTQTGFILKIAGRRTTFNWIFYLLEQTRAFIPDISKLNLQNFSWEQVKKNKEYINWFVILFLLFSALIKSYLILNK